MLYTRVPEVRSAHLKSLAAALGVLGEARAQEVRRALTPWVLRRIEAAGRLEWLPAEFLVELCQAVAGLDEGVLRPWGAASLERTLQNPLVRAAYEVALAVGGRQPATMLRHLVRVWPLLYAGCGDLSVAEAGATAVRVFHSPVPALLRREATVLPLVGALEAIPSHCGVSARGTAEWTSGSDRFVYVVDWSHP